MPPREGKICLAQRAGMLLWITAQVISASALPVQPEARYRAGKPATEATAIADQQVRAFAPAAAVETLASTLFAAAAQPEPPIELWLDARLRAVPFPPRRQSDPLRSAQSPAWVLLCAATAVLTTVNTRHHRRRTHAGCRHPPNPLPHQKSRARTLG